MAANDLRVLSAKAGADGSLALWVGVGDGKAQLDAIQGDKTAADTPFDLQVKGMATPFRVASVPLHDGGHVYLGVSERDGAAHWVLRKLRWRFLLLWLLNVLLGSAIVFFTARRMLRDVQEITEAASRIGESDLSQRVPATGRNDEVGQLASTLNRMLDRIEKSIHQLHTITNSLAHDLRSPLTAIRAKLEMSLTAEAKGPEADSIVAAIDEIDMLTEVLTRSLDVAGELKPDALRLNRTVIDLNDLLQVMIELYEPSMSEKELRIELRCAAPVEVFADAALLHRMFANLFGQCRAESICPCRPAPVTISAFGAVDDFAVVVHGGRRSGLRIADQLEHVPAARQGRGIPPAMASRAGVLRSRWSGRIARSCRRESRGRRSAVRTIRLPLAGERQTMRALWLSCWGIEPFARANSIIRASGIPVDKRAGVKTSNDFTKDLLVT